MVIGIIIILISSLKAVNANISDEFRFVINTIGVPEYNVYNYQINEEIYYKYNVFVYSDPINLIGKSSLQRFKVVQDKGKWISENGIRGEYNLLGYSYSGGIVHNVYFPVDAVPETSPEFWKYVAIPGARASWDNKNLYKYQEQLDFMKYSNLLFDEIDYEKNYANPYNLIEYNISANKIGLDNIILNTSATWKTMGVVNVKRRNNKGQIRDATLVAKPMAANADIKSILTAEDEYKIKGNMDVNNLSIRFGAQAINLNNYANEKHIKEIYSKIYIDDKEIATISGSKTTKVDKLINFVVNRKMYISPNVYKLKLKVVSYLYTEFHVDGLMQDTLEKTVNIIVEPKIENKISKYSIGILKIKNIDNIETKVVSPLVQTKNTNSANSLGFVESKRKLLLKLTFDNNSVIDIKNIKCNIDGINVNISELEKFKNTIILKLEYEKDLECTLKSWSYLRNIKDSFFDIDFNSIGNRIKSPHVLEIVNNVENNDQKIKILFDSIDNYEENINFIFNKDIFNLDKLNNYIILKEWVENEE